MKIKFFHLNYTEFIDNKKKFFHLYINPDTLALILEEIILLEINKTNLQSLGYSLNPPKKIEIDTKTGDHLGLDLSGVESIRYGEFGSINEINNIKIEKDLKIISYNEFIATLSKEFSILRKLW